VDTFSVGGGMIVAMVEGLLYRVRVNGNVFAVDHVPSGMKNNPSIPLVWMQETDGHIVIQDNQSAAIIYNGVTARRSDREKNEVPIGRMMAYGNGRLWVATDNEIRAGNIKTDRAGSELIFTETQYLNGGGAFYFPRKISGLRFMPTADTSTGYGSLMVFGNDNVDTLHAEISSRDLWADYPNFVTTALPGIGAVSHTAIAQVNQDLFFRASDNTIRTLRQARAEINAPGNAPISNEVSRILDSETESVMDNASAIYFDGRVLFTCSPRIGPRGQIVYGGILSLDASMLSSMQGRTPPAYDGEWYGIRVAKLISGVFGGQRRAFAVSVDDDGYSRLWEIMRQEQNDVSFRGLSPTRCAIETRKYTFESKRQLKRLMYLELFLSGIQGAGTVQVYFRSDSHAQWIKWDEYTYSANMTTPEVSGKSLAVHPQFRTAVGTFSPPEPTSDITRYSLNVGYTFQIRVVWTGSLQVDQVLVYAAPKERTALANRGTQPTAGAVVSASGNEVLYSIPLETVPVDPDSTSGPGANDYVDETNTQYVDENNEVYVSQ
jgi:hypothetical protein